MRLLSHLLLHVAASCSMGSSEGLDYGGRGVACAVRATITPPSTGLLNLPNEACRQRGVPYKS